MSSVRRLLALHGLSWVLGLIVPLVILAGLADWLFHLDSVIRAALLLSLIGGALWLAFRYVLRPLFVRFADLDIAMRIEERWPGLNDRLASMIQFVHVDANDDRYGSPALREATVRQAVEEASAIDFREVIEPKPVLQALGLASGALLLGALLVLVAPGVVTNCDEPTGPAVWRSELASANSSRSGRAGDLAQGRAGRFLHAGCQRYVAAIKSRNPHRRPIILPTARKPRAAPLDRGGRVPGTD